MAYSQFGKTFFELEKGQGPWGWTLKLRSKSRYLGLRFFWIICPHGQRPPPPPPHHHHQHHPPPLTTLNPRFTYHMEPWSISQRRWFSLQVFFLVHRGGPMRFFPRDQILHSLKLTAKAPEINSGINQLVSLPDFWTIDSITCANVLYTSRIWYCWWKKIWRSPVDLVLNSHY